MAALTPSLPETLAAESRSILEAFGRAPWSDEYYLAGSAALAVYIGHRPVRSLDLMSGGNRLTSSERRDLLGAILENHPETTVETARNGLLSLRLGSVGVRLFYYPYPVIEPLEQMAGLWVASLMDIALMKLGAIISRGGKRDFIDLYLLSRELPLSEILERSADKFGHVRDFPLQALKGLADLSLARDEPAPSLTATIDWAEVENWIATDVRELARRQVGLPAEGGES